MGEITTRLKVIEERSEKIPREASRNQSTAVSPAVGSSLCGCVGSNTSYMQRELDAPPGTCTAKGHDKFQFNRKVSVGFSCSC